MGEYLTGTVGGEIEDAAWSRENEEEETAEDTLGNGAVSYTHLDVYKRQQ